MSEPSPPRGQHSGPVLVAGATGGTGRHVVAALRDAGIPVRALMRDAERARTVLGPGVDLVAGDVSSPETLSTALRGATAIVSTIGGRAPFGRNGFRAIDWLGNRALMDAALGSGARRFVVVTAGSAGRRTFPHRLAIAPYPWKGRAEDDLRRSGLDYTIVGPGGLTDAPGGRCGIRIATRGQYRVGRIPRADVAAVIVACLADPRTIGRTLTLVSDDTQPADAWRDALSALPAD